MRLVYSSLFAALFLPALAFAQAVPAGFAPGSLWLSTTTATSGDAVKIFTVVYDSTSAPIEGDVAFLLDGTALGTQHFKLAAGESQIVSQSWTAAAGAHSFAAELRNVTGASSAIANAKTNSVDITVAKPASTALSQLQDSVSSVIASSSPAVQNIAQQVFNATEDLRTKGAAWLNNELYADQSLASATPAHQGQVLGAETYKTPPTAPKAGSGVFAQAKFWILRILLSVFQLKWLFYAMLLVVIYIVFKVIQGFFRYQRPL